MIADEVSKPQPGHMVSGRWLYLNTYEGIHTEAGSVRQLEGHKTYVAGIPPRALTGVLVAVCFFPALDGFFGYVVSAKRTFWCWLTDLQVVS